MLEPCTILWLAACDLSLVPSGSGRCERCEVSLPLPSSIGFNGYNAALKMADPITLLSTAGAVANSIDALGKTINTIGELQSQFQDADPAVLNLDSQLVALNTALNDINVWAESTPEEPHHQVVMDLDRCVACCRILINKIDAEMASFQITPGNELDVASKFRLLLNGKDFENIQRMIGQQTEAFTLLLTACNT